MRLLAGDYERDGGCGLWLPRRQRGLQREHPQLFTAGPGLLGGAKSYATWSPADKAAGVTLSGGNLVANGCSATASVRATVGVSSGKWYWEIVGASSYFQIIGVGTSAAALAHYCGFDSFGWAYGESANKYHAGATAYGASFTNQVMGIKLDMDAGTIEFLKANVSQGTAFTGLSGVVFPMVSGDTGSATGALTANFGASAFTYSVPSGFNSGLYSGS